MYVFQNVITLNDSNSRMLIGDLGIIHAITPYLD